MLQYPIELWIVVGVIAGYICQQIAKEKGLKNPQLWFVGGFVGSILTIFLLATIRKKVAKKTNGSTGG